MNVHLVARRLPWTHHPAKRVAPWACKLAPIYRGAEPGLVGRTFEAVGAPQDKMTKSPNDTIVKISKPFLEWSIGD